MSDDIKLSVAVIVGTVVLLAGIVGIVQLIDTPDSLDPGAVTGTERNVKGSLDAPNTLVEFSDLQCPACSAAAPVVSEFVADYGDQVKLEYRHRPLVSLHSNALSAAYAAEAAGEQGKFWDVHDWLFANQSVWSEASVSAEYFYSQFGEALGLDKDLFTAAYNSEAVRQRVADDNAAAADLGINSTPTFYLNGEKRAGVLTYQELVDAFGLTEVKPSVTNSGPTTTEEAVTPEATVSPGDSE